MRYLGKKRWKLLDQKFADPIDQILYNRGINKKNKEEFLNPDFGSLSDPFDIKNVKQGSERIIKAIKANETIGIFADYDADGVTSGALLNDVLIKHGLRTLVYIPARDEGYGINKNGIDYFKKQGISLMVAVDMGVTGKEEIAYAANRKIDSIIIDHHLVQSEKLPKGIVINPKQNDDISKFKDYSACGLVYKFICALNQKTNVLSQSELKWLLDLVAISTIADMVPLVGENRVLAHFGLIVLRKTKRIGIEKLMQSAGINLEKINPGTIGFQIAPRLNAPGRIEHANIAYALLATDSVEQAKELAEEINRANIQRQAELERILNEAREMVIKKKLDQKKIILLASPGWQPGLVGLVAGRLMEEYARPAIVLEKGEKISRGSARSIEALHLLEAFTHVSDKLLSFGGHARAGGLSFENKQLESLYEKLIEYAEEKINDDDLIPVVLIDYQLDPDDLNFGLVNQLEKLEPYGFGNPKPLFMMKSQIISSVNYVGKEKQHLKCKIGNFPAIMFGAGEVADQPKIGQKIDVVFSPQINEWNDNRTIELQLIDWKISDKNVLE